MSNVTYAGMVAAAVTMNMRRKASEEELSAARAGASVTVVTEVHIEDGAKNFATVLATFLCENPEHADGTREDLAGIITRTMGLPKPFRADRLSKDLSVKSRKLVRDVLRHHGYPTDLLIKALDVRDIVRAGKTVSGCLTHTTETRFDVDAVTFNGKRYEYCLFDETSEMPWYRLGIKFAGRYVQLATVLAIRGIGIGQFQKMDAATHKVATNEQLARRAELIEPMQPVVSGS